MRRAVFGFVLCLAGSAYGAEEGLNVGLKNPDGYRIINVTSDSTPGWQPSVEMEQSATQALGHYFDLKDQGAYADAYAMLADINRSAQPFVEYEKQAKDFAAHAGKMTNRRVVKATWTKDPANAPKAVYTWRSTWRAST